MLITISFQKIIENNIKISHLSFYNYGLNQWTVRVATINYILILLNIHLAIPNKTFLFHMYVNIITPIPPIPYK